MTPGRAGTELAAAVPPGIDAAIDAAMRAANRLRGQGKRPEFLATSNPGTDLAALGFGYADIDGSYSGRDAHDVAFSLQSITKLFALVLALAHDGDRLWRHVGFRATELAYDSIVGLDRPTTPPNPMLNAGALVVTDRLLNTTGDAAEAVRAFIAEQSGDEGVRINESVAAAELARSLRNTALVYALADVGMIEHPPEEVLRGYVRQCAIEASCRAMAHSAVFLARAGRDQDSHIVLAGRQARRVNALLTLSGTYEASADVLFRVGLPLKSGIGGGILAIRPGQAAMCTWSPGLDKFGNPVAGLRALESFARNTDC